MIVCRCTKREKETNETDMCRYEMRLSGFKDFRARCKYFTSTYAGWYVTIYQLFES